MLLRILLIVTILIGIGAIAVTQFVVRPHVQTIIEVRDKNLKDYQNEKQAHCKTRNELKDTKGETVTLAQFKDHKAVVVFFVGTECPINNAYAPRLADFPGARCQNESPERCRVRSRPCRCRHR